MKVKFYNIPSFSDKTLTYTVRCLPTGEWKCNCLGFIMNEGKVKRAGRRPMCDHIRKARHHKLKYHGRK